jgi:hypothetical protein
MKITEFKKLIREEVRKVIKEEITTSSNPSEIKDYLDDRVEGIYVLDGGLKSNGTSDVNSLKKGKPLFYTSNIRTNTTELINGIEGRYPKYKGKSMTIVYIDKDGNTEVSTS